MKISADVALKIVRQVFIVLGSVGTWIGIDVPSSVQGDIEAFVAAIGPFILAVGMLWSWVREAIKWFKERKGA